MHIIERLFVFFFFFFNSHLAVFGTVGRRQLPDSRVISKAFIIDTTCFYPRFHCAACSHHSSITSCIYLSDVFLPPVFFFSFLFPHILSASVAFRAHCVLRILYRLAYSYIYATGILACRVFAEPSVHMGGNLMRVLQHFFVLGRSLMEKNLMVTACGLDYSLQALRRLI